MIQSAAQITWYNLIPLVLFGMCIAGLIADKKRPVSAGVDFFANFIVAMIALVCAFLTFGNYAH